MESALVVAIGHVVFAFLRIVVTYSSFEIMRHLTTTHLAGKAQVNHITFGGCWFMFIICSGLFS